MQNKFESIDKQHRDVIGAPNLNSISSWRSPFGPIYQIPLFIIFLIALCAPDDVLQRYPFTAWFALAVRGILLSIFSLADIKNFADSTDYPQIALLVCALHWVWLAFALVITALISDYVRAREGYVFWRFSRECDGRVGWKDLKIVFVGLLLFPTVLFVATMVPGDWSMIRGLTTKNRLGMGLLFWSCFWGGWFGIRFGLPPC